ncbi:MAG: EamA family transporter [Candidatus Nanopelagicales bacterium]
MVDDGSRDVRGVTRATSAAIAPPLVSVWIIWGSTYLGIAVLVQTLPGLLANGIRFLIATFLLGLGLVIFKGPRVLLVTRAQFKGAATMGVMLLGVGIGTLSMAERYVPSGIAALLVSVMPLWIILFRVRAGDRPSRLTIAGVAVGMSGLVAMLLPGGTTAVAGDDSDVVRWSLAIMVSSFIWAFFSWRSTRFDLPTNPLTTTFYEMLTAGAFLSIVGVLFGQRVDFADASTTSWLALGYLVIASLLAYTAYVWLLGNAPMSLIATYAYVNPVVAVFLGWLVVGEPITRDVLIGLTIVVGGVILVVSGERRPTLIEEPS